MNRGYPMVVYIFAYGTLIPMNYEKYPVVAMLKGYKRVYHPNRALYRYDYPFVVKKKGYSTTGIVLCEENESILDHWDAHEGYPNHYNRVLAKIKIISDPNQFIPSSEAVSLEAWVYVPSVKTLSLKIDKIFKDMKRKNEIEYRRMMEQDLWLERLLEKEKNIKQVIPKLFRTD